MGISVGIDLQGSVDGGKAILSKIDPTGNIHRHIVLKYQGAAICRNHLFCADKIKVGQPS